MDLNKRNVGGRGGCGSFISRLFISAVSSSNTLSFVSAVIKLFLNLWIIVRCVLALVVGLFVLVNGNQSFAFNNEFN